MNYTVVIHHEDGTAYGVTVPDIPGCFSAGDTVSEALINTKEAIEGHLQLLAEDGEVALSASDIDVYFDDEEFAGGRWALVDVDVTPYMGKAEKFTGTMPSIVLSAIEEQIKKGRAKNRSAFLTDAAMQMLKMG